MNKKYFTMIVAVSASMAIIAAAALPALAQTVALSSSVAAGVNGSATVSGAGIKARLSAEASATLAAHITTITDRANQEITRRVNALNALSARVVTMVRLSTTDKNNLSSSIQLQVGAMNSLQSQITADAAANNTSSLKLAVQSITASYRIFMLVLPQGTIEAAADRALTIVGIMNDLAIKFSARIQAAQSAGNNVAATQTTLVDLNAKVSDASTQVMAAAAEVASLTPDNGSSTIMASNTAALKDARSKIQAAQQDFVAARADAETIIKALAAFKVSATASTTVSASTSAE